MYSLTFTCHFFFIWSNTAMQVGNNQSEDVIEYLMEPKTEFQHYIRLGRKGTYIAILIRCFSHFTSQFSFVPNVYF
jgi:hypothetical protein